MSRSCIRHRNNLGKHWWLAVLPAFLVVDSCCCWWTRLDLVLSNNQSRLRIHCSCKYCMVFVVCLKKLECCRSGRTIEILTRVECDLTRSSSRFACADIGNKVCYCFPSRSSAVGMSSKSSSDDCLDNNQLNE